MSRLAQALHYQSLSGSNRNLFVSDVVRLGLELRGLEVQGESVRARFLNRQSETELTIAPDVLLGADGIHSQVRHHFYPEEGSPRWNGITLWRSTAPFAAPIGGRAMAELTAARG